MTLQEVKNAIAKAEGFDDWFSIDFNKTNLSQEALRDQVAIMYAQENVKEQRKIMSEYLTRMTEEQKEALGILIDEIDNLAHGLLIPMPDKMQVECLKATLPDKVKRFKELFIEITNENPWE